MSVWPHAGTIFFVWVDSVGRSRKLFGQIRRLFSFESAVTKLRSALSRLHAHNAHAISDRGALHHDGLARGSYGGLEHFGEADC